MRAFELNALRIQSTQHISAAQDAVRAATERMLTRNMYSEGCVAILFGSYLFAWRSSWRGWGFFSPGPVFRGRIGVLPPHGSELTGVFTPPIFNLLFGSFLLVASLVWCGAVLSELATGLNLALFGAVALVSAVLLFFLLFAWCLLRLPWWLHRGDVAYVERCLRRALESPAA